MRRLSDIICVNLRQNYPGVPGAPAVPRCGFAKSSYHGPSLRPGQAVPDGAESAFRRLSRPSLERDRMARSCLPERLANPTVSLRKGMCGQTRCKCQESLAPGEPVRRKVERVAQLARSGREAVLRRRGLCPHLPTLLFPGKLTQQGPKTAILGHIVPEGDEMPAITISYATCISIVPPGHRRNCILTRRLQAHRSSVHLPRRPPLFLGCG